MSYTPITEVDNPVLFYGQWSKKGSPKPRLAAYIDADDTTLTFTAPFLDRLGAVVTAATIIGIKKANGWVESVYVPANGFSVDGLTATGCVRGLRPDGLDYTTGDTSFADEHDADEIVFCNISAIIQAVTIGGLTGTLGANIKFNSRMLFMGDGINACPIFADATARDAAITAPQNGDQCYNTAVGMFQDYTAGSWVDRASGGTFPNATTAVAGKVELATQAENNAGTATGGTGASIVATPAIQAVSTQNQVWVYGTDTGSANTYAVTLTPAPTSYTAGFSVELKIANANSGASTLNVNALGAKNIYKNGSLPLEADDLQAGMIARFTYDGTQFQLVGAINNGTGYGADDAVYVVGTLGDTISASDISNNLNLVYQLPSDMKWYKVTSTTTTWYYKLGLAAQAGTAGDSKKILIKGTYSNQSFSNINPTFSTSATGTNINVGDTTGNALRAFSVVNTSAAECVVTGGTISARQQGTPAGAMQIYLVLQQQDIANTPAAFRDATNNVARGAIIGSATIAQASFSGTYQSLAFSFGASVKIPAGVTAYLVIGKTGAADGANYYQCQSSAATLAYSTASPGWSGTVNTGNYTLTVTSTSPVGYSVKAYTGTNGSYGLAPANPWARPIGQVMSTTELFFDPLPQTNVTSYGGYAVTATSGTPIDTITTNFCPVAVTTTVNCTNDATADANVLTKGYVRGDTATATSLRPTGMGDSAAASATYGGGVAFSSATQVAAPQIVQGISTTSIGTQNMLYIARLESGFYAYIGYPTGANFISGGAAGYVKTIMTEEFMAQG